MFTLNNKMKVNRILRCVPKNINGKAKLHTKSTSEINNSLIDIEPIVTNKNVPSCVSCKYFIENGEGCNKFQRKNVIYNIVEPYEAKYCRYNEKKCGLNALYYKELENNKLWYRRSCYLLYLLRAPLIIFSSFGVLVYNFPP